MTAHNLATCVGPSLLSPPEEHTLPLDMMVQVMQKVTQLVAFLIQHHGELFEEEEAGLGGASGKLEAGTAEVPPVVPESKRLQSSSQESRLPGSSHESRKRKPTREEESDWQPERKRSKLERELSGTGN
ncbi:uncharacterized protein FN964_012992 [Alca torda]